MIIKPNLAFRALNINREFENYLRERLENCGVRVKRLEYQEDNKAKVAIDWSRYDRLQKVLLENSIFEFELEATQEEAVVTFKPF